MKLTDLPSDTMITANELAQILRVHTTTVCKWANMGKIPNVKIGRTFRFNIGAIRKWLWLEGNDNATTLQE